MYQDFSSLPPEQERDFVVFEQRTRESAKSAFTIGAVVAAIYGLLMVIIVVSHDKPAPLIGEEDVAGSEILSAGDEREEPAPTPEPAAEPAADDTAVEGEGEAAAEGEAAEAPPPPAGATKAPPTALTGGQ